MILNNEHSLLVDHRYFYFDFSCIILMIIFKLVM